MNATAPFIQSIRINKVRHLRGLNILIDQTRPRHLMLTGPNGSGKTSVLVFLKTYLAGIQDGQIVRIEELRNKIKTHESTISKLQQLLLEDTNSPNREQQKAESAAQILSTQHAIIQTQRRIDPFTVIEPSLSDLPKVIEACPKGEFIIAFFDAKRKTEIQIADGAKKLELPKINPIHQNQLAPKFLQFLVNQENRAAILYKKGEKEEVAKLETWMANLTNRFRSLFNNSQLKLVYDIDTFDFTIQMPGREPFRLVDNQLSDGFSAVIQIIAELLLRMEALSSGRYDMPGIVLIDEIETHLHIELQKQILPFLTDFFPNIQFIVTTHSPFVLTSLSDAVVFDLESGKRWECLAPFSATTVVEDYFDSDLYSAESKRMIDRYRGLIRNTNRTPDEDKELSLLRQQLDTITFDQAPELHSHYQHLRAQEL